VPRINTQRSENTPVQVPVFIIMVLCLLVEAHSARALDHDNLDPNRPIAIEDAYVIPKGEIGVEGGLTFNDRKEGKSRFGFQPQIIYGAFDNTQIEIMSGLVTEPSTVVGDDKSGDLSVAALYNFNAETLAVPAFAARVEVGLPTGVRSKGIDTELTGVVTRSFGRWRTHVNVGYTFLGSPQQHERSGTYRIVAAVSYPLGYPMSFTDTLIVNAFTRQSDLQGQTNPTGIGAGLRHQVSSRVVFDAGVGTEFLGPADRSIFFSTIGFSLGF
jgi:outer membrane putative beta-barrel porin/alpha-amylase